MLKTCKICQIEKNISDFYFRKDNNTYRAECKECIKLRSKKYYELNEEDRKNYNKQWYADNKDYVLDKQNKYYESNKNRILEIAKIYYQSHKYEKQEYDKEYLLNNKNKINERHKKYDRLRSKNDPSFRLRKQTSRLILMTLKNNNATKNGQSILLFLPYTMVELKNHLECQFEPWMNWHNQGKYKSTEWDDDNPSTWTWQLDHIIPQSDLPYSSMAEDNFKKCWSLDNLRPLSAKQNVLDGTNRVRHSTL